MVTASKRFTIHRSSNVLTISLKRFANFSGGKITKVGARCEIPILAVDEVVLDHSLYGP